MLPVIWPFGISIFHCSLSLTSLITDGGNINKNYPRLTSRKTVAWQPSCFVKNAELKYMTREVTDSCYR